MARCGAGILFISRFSKKIGEIHVVFAVLLRVSLVILGKKIITRTPRNSNPHSQWIAPSLVLC